MTRVADRKHGSAGRCSSIAFIAGAVALAVATPVAADEGPPGDPGSAVDQYVEVIPTSTGGQPVLSSASTRAGGGQALPPRLQARVRSRGGGDAPALLNIASSPELGAPQKRLALQGRFEANAPDDSGALSAAQGFFPGVAAAVSGGTARVVGLLLVLAAVSAAMVAAAVRRTSR